jgi:hypothetical protein
VNRRLFLQRSFGGGLLISAGWLFHKWLFPSVFSSYEQKTLVVYLDCLIPADDTPSAVELGIDKRLLSLTEQYPKFTPLLKQGLEWLESQAQYSFHQAVTTLTIEQVNTLITLAAQAPFESLPHQFFLQTRHQSMQWYYADPRSRIGSIWEKSPQPEGFMNYQQMLKFPS